MALFEYFRGLFVDGAKHTRPEGLWKRYVFGAAVFTLLIFSAFHANNIAIDRGLVDARIMNEAGRMRMLSQRIILLSTQIQAGQAGDNASAELGAALDRFEAVHNFLTQSDGLTPELQAAYFEAPRNVDARSRLFLATARDFKASVESGDAGPDAVNMLVSLGQNELLRDLDHIVGLFEATSQNGTVALRELQSLILLAAVVVLLLEAGFIYLPAHLAVVSKIAELRHKTRTLKESRAKLRQANRALKKSATHDPLTGLPNRARLIEQIGEALDDKNEPFSLILIDISRFRWVNDTAGEQTGDALLCKIAVLLEDMTSQHDLVARIGGNEFAVMTTSDPTNLMARLHKVVDDPIQVSGRVLQIGFYIGYADRRPEHRDALALYSDAELALKTAKSNGRAEITAYTCDLRAALEDKNSLTADIRTAIENGEIVPFFQPQIDLKTGTLCGAEVLARWQHPKRGLVPPDSFLGLAASEGLARELDYAVWAQAMHQFVTWQKSGMDLRRISLNASPDTIADPRFVHALLTNLATFKMTVDQVTIEVLETTFIGSVDDIAAINIDRLIGAGVKVELDDFGTGFASLSKLIQLSLSGIKLDRSLIHPLPSPGAESIVRAMHAMASEMELHVVAEGIETPAQQYYLRELGCHVGQGYGIGRPMAGNDFADWLQAQDTHEVPLSPITPLRA